MDGTLTVIGKVPDKGKKEALLKLLEPVSEAGYRIIDKLSVKS